MMHKYLFYMDNKKIKTYQYRDKEFELIRDAGEDCYQGDYNLFWKWWEKVSSFIQETDEIDFCFLCNDTKVILPPKYKLSLKNSWFIEEIRDFICKYLNYAKILLKQNDIEKAYKIKHKKISDIYMNNIEAMLYLKMIPQSDILIKEIDLKPTIEEEAEMIGEESSLARYYRTKTESYT